MPTKTSLLQNALLIAQNRGLRALLKGRRHRQRQHMGLRVTEGMWYGPAVELTEEQKQHERAYTEHKGTEDRSRIEA